MTNASNENLLADDLEHVLTYTRDAWELARGKRFFVTGGTGFFGRWLLESFAHANRALDLEAEMIVLSRNPQGFGQKAPHLVRDAGIVVVEGDVRTLSPAASFGGKFDFVIHAATEASAKLNSEDPGLMFSTIVGGTRAVLDFSVAWGASRFLLTSSGAVYGTQPSQMTHMAEDYLGGPDCTTPASAYAEGKRAAELLCGCYHKQHGIEPLIARCFAFVGPFLPLDTHFAIGNFIRDAVAAKPISIRGDGTPRRSYLYAADLAIWLLAILFRGHTMRVYNVGSCKDVSIQELAEAVRDAVNPGLEIHLAEAPRAGARDLRYVPDTSRARRELQLHERIDLPEAIRRTVRAARALELLA